MMAEIPNRESENSKIDQGAKSVLEPEIIDMGLDVSFTKEYLETKAGSGCYGETNLDTPESLTLAEEKIEPLKKFSPHPKNIVSIGVGAGEELRAVAEIYKGEQTVIYGLDLSPRSLSIARERLLKYGLDIEMIEGSAIGLPFADHSMDGIIESSILHEIYSYVPDGKNAWKKAIAEVATKLSENGIYLLRDFSGPIDKGDVQLNLTSDIAKKFYDYFREFYRTFSSCNPEDVKNIIDKRIPNNSDLPQYDLQSHMVTLPFGMASEVMLHFRNFYDNYTKGITNFDDPNWKEINESYLPPNPNIPGINVMTKDEYAETVLTEANNALGNTEYKMVCVQNKVSARPEAVKFLADHFVLSLQNSDKNSETLLSETTRKMELVFKKQKKNV